uniref:Uncharacterized protein n=1 Tax=Arundo donax TaxID=35708 RepID=A0A0A9CN70_ARUDO
MGWETYLWFSYTLIRCPFSKLELCSYLSSCYLVVLPTLLHGSTNDIYLFVSFIWMMGMFLLTNLTFLMYA